MQPELRAMDEEYLSVRPMIVSSRNLPIICSSFSTRLKGNAAGVRTQFATLRGGSLRTAVHPVVITLRVRHQSIQMKSMNEREILNVEQS